MVQFLINIVHDNYCHCQDKFGAFIFHVPGTLMCGNSCKKMPVTCSTFSYSPLDFLLYA